MEKNRIIVMGAVGATVIAVIVGGVVLTRFASPVIKTAPQPSITTTPVADTGPTTRDAQRYADVTALRIALNGYSGSTGHFPAALADLVPKYLAALPNDPGTGQPYPYVFKDGAYTVSFTLEQGAVSLASGDHFLTPRGFDLAATAIADRGTTTTSSKTIPPPPGSGTKEDATNPDTDNDGLTDADEITYRTDPEKADTDGDGIADGDEVHVFGTQPLNADTDGDTFSDGQELEKGFEPNGAGSLSAGRKAAINAAAKQYGIHSPTHLSLPMK